MHVVTGISFFLLGIASIVAVKVLVKFQLRTLQLFGFSELFRGRFAKNSAIKKLSSLGYDVTIAPTAAA